MKKQIPSSIKKFLKFNGKNVYFVSVDGTWWIAIKPICEALGVDYERQRKNLKDDKILGQLPSMQTVVAGDGRLRKMVCLPEFYIYGWIFKLRSDNPALEEYQWKCYEVLYNYFHGAVTERNNLLRQKTKADLEIEKLEEELEKVPIYQELQKKKKNRIQVKKSLTKMDKQAVSEQLDLWSNQN